MTKLDDHIVALITKDGALSVAEFMRIALQHPEFGYYRHGDPLGQGGDFITAPEISQMFGEMIGIWCAEMWSLLGKPAQLTLLEMGPGRGTLMQDLLRVTAKIPGFHAALRLYLLESSETLRAAQAEKLGMYHPEYIADLAELPSQPTLIIANEFFDALPIRQFEKSPAGWCERLVTVADGKLAFTLSTPDPAFKLLIPEALHEAKEGTVYELSPATLNLMRDVAKHVAAHNGAALVIDYGFAQPDGRPTLQAVANHHYAPVLENVGDADLTSLVDFGLLRRAATLPDTKTFGAMQGEFLSALGIDFRAEQLKRRATPQQTHDIDSALHRLTNPAAMGSLFKVLAVTSSALSDIPGF